MSSWRSLGSPQECRLPTSSSMGDFNEEFNAGKKMGSLFAGIVEFAYLMGLEDVIQAIYGGEQGQRRFWTRKEGDLMSCPDHFLASRCITTRETVRRVGVHMARCHHAELGSQTHGAGG